MAGFEANQSKPLWLLAELTYRCPLQCPYCSNPVEIAKYQEELSTDDWIRVMREARKMGATQLGFSGGEPLVRQDLEELIAEARENDGYAKGRTIDELYGELRYLMRITFESPLTLRRRMLRAESLQEAYDAAKRALSAGSSSWAL